MKTLINKFDKKLLATLPVVAFDKRIVLVNSVFEAERAVSFLLKQPVLGFDTETKPTFQRGTHHEVALLQVGTLDVCFLFRLNQMGLPDCLLKLLTDTDITKVGLSLKDDISGLCKLRRFVPGTFLELQDFVRGFGVQDMSLQKLYANVFGQKISKSQQLTNWEADVLTEKQKIYAATDAWACVMLYNELCRLRTEGYQLEVVPELEPQESATLMTEIKLPREKKVFSTRGKKTSSKKNNKNTKARVASAAQVSSKENSPK